MKELEDSRMLTGIRIHEDGDLNDAAPDLELLADQLSAIANELRHGSGERGGANGSGQINGHQRPARPAGMATKLVEVTSAVTADERFGFQQAQQKRTSAATTARQVYGNRRRRTALFGNGELFGEPAWDILLDLYIAHAENKPVSVSSACIGSASPPTTGLRWLGVLAENELILREHDPEDQRRVLVRLTDRGIAAMDEYFNKAEG